MFISTETWNGSMLANVNLVETIEPYGAPDVDGNIAVKVYFSSGRVVETTVHQSEAEKINRCIQLVEIKKDLPQQNP